MSIRSTALLAVSCAAVLAVAGCSKSSPPIPTTGGDGSTSGTSTTHPAKRQTHFPTTRRSLSTFVAKAIAKASTVHVTYHQLAGQNVVDIAGDEQLLRGQVADATFTETTSSSTQPTKIVIKDQVLYVRLPADAHAARPWIKAGKHSANRDIRSLYGTLQALSASGAENVPGFLSASTSFAKAGTGSVDGIPVGKYTLMVSVAKLPKSYPLKAALQTEGVPQFSVQLSVDAKGLPRELDESIEFNGEVVTSQVGLSRYGAHVRVAAPPARLVRSA